MKNVGILTMELHENRPAGSVGSSRIRGTWLVNNWPEAELFRIGKKYDAVIFQKAYHIEFMKAFEGVKIFDLCDPDWLDGKPVKEAIELCDAVTTSTEALAEYVRTMTDKPVRCVADRLDMAEHTALKHHEGRAKGVAWFGYHQNHPTIDQVLPSLKRLGLTLTVVSDMPYYPQARMEGIEEDWIRGSIRNVKYDYATLNDELVASSDIVVNPRLETGRFKFKSNNKTLTAWACGLPVALDGDDLERLMDGEVRAQEAEARLKEVQEAWDVRQSVWEYQDIIQAVQAARSPA